MALSLVLGEESFSTENINTEAVVSLDEVDDGFAVTHIALAVNATIADISIAQCQTVCKQTKKDCPISKLFNTEISLNATLK